MEFPEAPACFPTEMSTGLLSACTLQLSLAGTETVSTVLSFFSPSLVNEFSNGTSYLEVLFGQGTSFEALVVCGSPAQTRE